MEKIRQGFRRSFAVLAAVMLIGLTPIPVMAENAAPANTAQSSDTASAGNTTGGPTGADAVTYTFNASTGLWENDYYTYNPSTKETVPKVPLEYTYNPASGKWDTQLWEYNAAQQAYQQVTISLAAPPQGAKTYGGPPADTAQPADTTTTVATQQPAAGPLPGNTPATEQKTTDTSTDTETQKTGTQNTNQSNATDATLTNTIISDAASGKASATNNDDIGGVASGNAVAMANVVNLLQSQASFGGGGLATFTANIQGNVTGDFLIDPASLAQPAGISPNNLANAKITNQTNGTIVNNIDLSAASGDALAEDNDDVGSVSSGNANAVADVINMINSVVAANQSFLGVINIYGDYTGNIVMPVGSLNALLASGGDSASAAAQSSTVDNNFTAAVANNVNLAASSGKAAATNNDDIGSVTSGNGLTNLTILNLTGRQVVAANSLLVFVNVLGSWVGLIMDAPAGTTSAALGGGVAGNSSLPATNSNISNTENYGITNNIQLAAASGDATARNNDDVGSVRSGDATASASIANLINSSFSLSNWFGVLFINVFGNWKGDFGVMKPPVVAPITSGAALPGQSAGGNLFGSAKVFTFVPKSSLSSTTRGGAGSNNFTLSPVQISDTKDNNSEKYNSGNVLAAANTDTGDKGQTPGAAVGNAVSSSMNYWSIVMFAIAASGFGLVGLDRVRRNLRNHATMRS